MQQATIALHNCATTMLVQSREVEYILQGNTVLKKNFLSRVTSLMRHCKLFTNFVTKELNTFANSTMYVRITYTLYRNLVSASGVTGGMSQGAQSLPEGGPLAKT